jgi:hypothetical protein
VHGGPVRRYFQCEELGAEVLESAGEIVLMPDVSESFGFSKRKSAMLRTHGATLHTWCVLVDGE